MTPTTLWLIIFIGIALWNLYVSGKWKAKYEAKDQDYIKLLSQKKSSEVRLGQISEQLAPFVAGFNYDTKQAHFLGQPIDYICFEKDKIVFLEVKSGKAQLSSRQKEIKQLIQDKKVEWAEMRIDGTPAVPKAKDCEIRFESAEAFEKAGAYLMDKAIPFTPAGFHGIVASEELIPVFQAQGYKLEIKPIVDTCQDS